MKFNKSIFGMIHLASVVPVERAIEEIKIYEEEGLQGIIVENYHGGVNDIIDTLEITLSKLAEQILQTPPEQGYLTISNALQWRLQYQRIVALVDDIPGISKIVSYKKPK